MCNIASNPGFRTNRKSEMKNTEINREIKLFKKIFFKKTKNLKTYLENKVSILL